MSEPAHDYITLKEAADFYPVKSVSTLRRERDKGTLACYRIGNVDYTTHADVREMFQKCRVVPSRPVSYSANDTAGNRSSSSSTRDSNVALVSALQAAKRLKSA